MYLIVINYVKSHARYIIYGRRLGIYVSCDKSPKNNKLKTRENSQNGDKK